MIHRVMTDDEIKNLEKRVSELRHIDKIQTAKLTETRSEIRKIEYQIRHQKILNKMFDEVFPKKK
ncbi:hypothetical protein [Bacillus sp. AFS019443]|uniref:hypothetical protein n=1 Tax=Bacillus sp. AFS019443 TaxID=2034279 RepID=UPI000BF60631|nr:hypothetical protein [Bacillus sp. AFS019443]PEU16798.1 hypothetical protein CN524_03460 [Bacillus sp. AFS019443]